MYGRGPLGARRFCKECTERYITSNSYQNALLNFGGSSVSALGEGGGGGGREASPPLPTG